MRQQVTKECRWACVTPQQVKAIAQLIAGGVGITVLAPITGRSRPTIYRVLENRQRGRAARRGR